MGFIVYATGVEARHPDTEAYEAMVVVRAAAGTDATMQQWVATAGGLHVAGRRWPLFPVTHVREPSHGLPRDGGGGQEALAARPRCRGGGCGALRRLRAHGGTHPAWRAGA